MDEAEVVDRSGGYWVVEAAGRRYYLSEEQFSSRQEPHVGQKGVLGYVQGAASKVLTFSDHERRD
jgi:hypothetical protein